MERFWRFLEKPLTQTGVAMVLAIIGTIVPSKIAMVVAGLVFFFAAYREGWFTGQQWYVALGRVVASVVVIAFVLGAVWEVAWRFRERPVPVAQNLPPSMIAPPMLPVPAVPQKPEIEKPPKKSPPLTNKHKESQVQGNKGSNDTNTEIGTAQGPVAIAPNGIAIGGGTVTNPTVNNNFSAPPQRTISPDQRSALIACLGTNPGKYTVGAPSGNREAYIYAQDWSGVFHAAGWTNEQPIPVVTVIESGPWPAMQFAAHGTFDNASKPVMVDGSPEKTAVECLMKIPTSKGGKISAFQDMPTGSVRLDVSDREN